MKSGIIFAWLLFSSLTTFIIVTYRFAPDQWYVAPGPKMGLITENYKIVPLSMPSFFTKPFILNTLLHLTSPVMAVSQLSGSGLWLPYPSTITGHSLQLRTRLSPTSLSAASPPLPPPSIQIVGGKNPNWYGDRNANYNGIFEGGEGETDWVDLDADLHHWTKALRPVQWYPGHIAKTEKELKEQLKLMDVVIEVRDARIPMSTSHPQMESWLGNRKRILVLNREDMISNEDRNAWAMYYGRQGIKVILSNGKQGMGTMKLSRLAKALATDVNVKRRAKGLLPRAVRAGIVGYPNVGKSSLINRLLKRRMCPAAPRPGVTRDLRWIRFGKDLELLDSPGIIPMRISDQSAAVKLAICDDIGERSYDVDDVAAILIQMLTRLPSVGTKAFYNRYKIDADGLSGKIFVQKLAGQLFNGDVRQAAFRVLSDFRKGRFGWVSLERPPM